MITKHEVLNKINEIILEEKGRKVTMDSKFTDAELDSLGTIITLITIDSEFHIFDPDKTEKDLTDLDIENLIIRDLVVKCVLSNINTSEEQKTGKAT